MVLASSSEVLRNYSTSSVQLMMNRVQCCHGLVSSMLCHDAIATHTTCCQTMHAHIADVEVMLISNGQVYAIGPGSQSTCYSIDLILLSNRAL